MRAYCFAQNIDVTNGNSAWHRRHGMGQWTDRTIPFGCLIDFKPQPAVVKHLPKCSPDAIPGIFWGYKLLPGGVWQGDHRVADLLCFADIDFFKWGSNSDIFRLFEK